MKRSSLLLLSLGMLAAVLAAGAFLPRALDANAGVDFLQYWSAARLTWSGSNPYDPQSMLAHQDRVWRGGGIPRPVSMWNPPQILSLMLVFAVPPFEYAYSLWLSAALVLIAGCCWLCVRLYGAHCAARPIALARLLFFASFPPFATALYFGQVSPLLLAGFCLALWAERGGKPLLAGLALSLTVLKPHLLYLYYVYYLLRELRAGRGRSLLACAAGVLALSALPAALEPGIFSHYLAAYAEPPITWRTPTAGSWLQGALGVHQAWVRMLPSAICLAALSPWLLRRCSNRGALLFLVPLSLVTSPYGWQYDQMLLLPMIVMLFGEAEYLYCTGSRRRARLLSALLLAANLAFFLIPKEYGQETAIWYPLYFAAVALACRPDRRLEAAMTSKDAG